MRTQQKVLANIFEICGLSHAIVNHNLTSSFIIIRAGFDVLEKIEAIYPEKKFIRMKIENIATREILYHIFSEILGSAGNPRKCYGTNLRVISKNMKKKIPEGIFVLSDNVNPEAIERILCLDIPVCVIAQPKYCIKKLSELVRNYERKAIEIKTRADPGALEHYARFILPNITNRNPLNPWHPFTSHALTDVLNLTKGNIILFSYILGNLGQADFVDELELKGVLEAAYREYLEGELSLVEREVLRQTMCDKVLETDLKQNCPSISNTKLLQLLRKLSKLNLIKKSRDYSDYESVYYELNPDMAKIIDNEVVL